MKVLHVAAEVYPWVKTGGLADVVAALPPALAALGADVRLLLPGFAALLNALQGPVQTVAECGPCFGAMRVRLLRGVLPLEPAVASGAAPGAAPVAAEGERVSPGRGLVTYLIDAPYSYQRAGGPYHDESWRAWPDNAERFALLGWMAAQLGAGGADPEWQPQIVHGHDWHAALASAWLHEASPRGVASVFSVHNLAFQGLVPLADAPLLQLGARWLTPAGLEFHGQLNMLKAGVGFAQRVTTVSPTYAREIATPEFGCGLEGLIASRRERVSGILNGIDNTLWNPAHDADLPAAYSAERPQGKQQCRDALLSEYGLVPSAAASAGSADALVLAVVSRLTAQKGLDLLLACLPALLARGVRLVLQGSGDSALESAFRRLQQQHPQQVRVFTDFDESRAHRIIAGADCIVVPSRFEPCGLTQLYGLRYGTVPVVRRVGGLADTVLDATPEALAAGSATGFCFDAATPAALLGAVERAIALHAKAEPWQALMSNGMRQDFTWGQPARQYLAVYEQALRDRGVTR